MELYHTLQIVWWVLLGVLLSGLAVMVGMDMGVGIILRYVGRTDIERRVALNIIGPHWGGNQVWFVLGGGAIFAAFPLIYATAFSGFYVVMLVLLWTMIVRPLGFEYRAHIDSPRWRSTWDWALFISGFVPMLVFGAAVGNILQGVPFNFSWNLTSFYTGSFWRLLNPFAILCGLLSVALSIYMGGSRIMSGAEGAIRERARHAATLAGIVAVLLYALGGVWLRAIDGFTLAHAPAPGTAQTPLQQTVTRGAGAWYENFAAQPLLWLLPVVAFVAILAGIAALRNGRALLAWWLGALGWIGVITSVGVAMFPFMLPSSSVPAHSLTLWNASSSSLTLAWMLGFTVIFIPLIVWYTSWAFYMMRGKVNEEQVASDEHAY